MSELWRLSAVQLARAVRRREVSASEVTQAHLDRLDAVNPAINAVVQDCAEEALAAAATLDARISLGEYPGRLAGVPVTIKVNVDQAGHATTNGLRISKDAVAQNDSPVVANLRRAGAIVVGRTNTPAFSLRWFTKNDLHGQTLNPRNKLITPGGSSGGAAAAVASGICAIGHGTDIAGSIRYPAYACGLHGLRPTLGRVPAYNASAPDRFIGAQLMAVSGPIARSIEDIALSFHAMATADPRDPWYTPAPLDGAAYARRIALALAPDNMPVDGRVRDSLVRAARTLQDAGWEVEEVSCPPMREAAAVNATLWMADTRFAAQEMIAREGEPDSQFVFQQMSLAAGPIDLDSVMRALQTRASLVRQWEMFLSRYPVLLCPVSGDLPFDQQLDVSSQSAFAAVYEAQLTQRGLPTMGMPALSLATGYADGRPVGVQLVSARFREDILLAVGATLEAAGHHPGVSDPFSPG
ncbi:amidase family protein [Tabrizicola sp.]|uniref:amidase family protein n=1 Tax=Tabrizicola sp. TaxID=2005166 RepID=UPI0026231A02|nr:amidase family protein [Tabrizicola sp.]MDM7932281.1 amidase family protein [Tabrizicola sp.]